jgi:general secretion pathway protein A
LTRDVFVEMLALRFKLSPQARGSKTTLLFELEEILRSRDEAGESTVLLVDVAQSLPRDILEEIRLLANIETNERKLLSVIMAGQPEVTALLNDPDLRQLKQRIALRCELRPLSLQETAGYLAGRIRAAGGVGAQVFTREAVTLVHERSKGIPRTISVIADNALLTGFAVGQRPVNSATVREVCRDFDLGVDAEAGAVVPAAEARPSTTQGAAGLLVMQSAGPGVAPGEGTALGADNPGQTPGPADSELFGSTAKRRLLSFLRG